MACIQMSRALVFLVLGTVPAAALVAGEATEKPDGPTWGTAIDGLQVSVSLAAKTVRPCTPVVLRIAIRNVGKRERSLFEMSPEQDYRVIVTAPDGKPAPLTACGKRVVEARASTRLIGRKLGPGQVLRTSLVANRVRDMTLTGEYTISVARRYVIPTTDPNKRIEVQWNCTKVTVR